MFCRFLFVHNTAVIRGLLEGITVTLPAKQLRTRMAVPPNGVPLTIPKHNLSSMTEL